MNIEKIKNFNQDEQKTLNFFELLRNEIIRRDNELNEGIDFIFGRKFANKIDILLNLVIDRIDYDIKKNKEIISKNTNICASYRRNDYQIVRLRAMNTKSLDIKNRLQELLEGDN